MSLDDAEAPDPRFSTVPLYAHSDKEKPLTTSGPPSPSSHPARRRNSSVIGSPTQSVIAAAKQSRRKTISSGSSAGNLPLLLARLEQKSAKEEADPALKRASVDGTGKLIDGFKRMQVEQIGQAEEVSAGGIDWAFWGEVVASAWSICVVLVPTNVFVKIMKKSLGLSLRNLLGQ